MLLHCFENFPCAYMAHLYLLIFLLPLCQMFRWVATACDSIDYVHSWVAILIFSILIGLWRWWAGSGFGWYDVVLCCCSCIMFGLNIRGGGSDICWKHGCEIYGCQFCIELWAIEGGTDDVWLSVFAWLCVVLFLSSSFNFFWSNVLHSYDQCPLLMSCKEHTDWGGGPLLELWPLFPVVAEDVIFTNCFLKHCTHYFCCRSLILPKVPDCFGACFSILTWTSLDPFSCCTHLLCVVFPIWLQYSCIMSNNYFSVLGLLRRRYSP
jgi:hypothetical protein